VRHRRRLARSGAAERYLGGADLAVVGVIHTARHVADVWSAQQQRKRERHLKGTQYI